MIYVIGGPRPRGYTITVDFGSMESSEAFISKLISSDTSKNIIGSDLYPQHMWYISYSSVTSFEINFDIK